MTALHPTVATLFCKLCNDAYEAFQRHRGLFDDNLEIQRLLTSSHVRPFLQQLSETTQQFALLQLLKLHDAAVVSHKITLSIDYVMRYGGWSTAVFDCLKDLAKKLNAFAEPLRSLRNQVLAHNDLAALLSTAPLGTFNKDDDKHYFATLQEFVDIVHNEACGGGPYPFRDTVQNDVDAFVSSICPRDLEP